MVVVRVLLALLLLSATSLLPTGVQAGSRHHYGAEHCVISHEEMEIILIRRDPNNHSLIEKRVFPGECGVRVVDNCRHGFCPVRQGQFDGWMHRKNLAPVSAAVYCVTRVDRGWSLDLHAEPSHSTRVVVSLNDDFCGIAVTPVRVGHWVKVKAGRYYGWVSVTNLE
jgi:SH3-like domain-containing protein